VTAGSVILAELPTSTGAPKLRPVLILAEVPGPYGDLLVCGISTQVHLHIPDWDEHLRLGDADYVQSGLRYPSIIRLSYVGIVSPLQVQAVLGTVEVGRLKRLRSRLADLLNQEPV
jgi:mRNA interferase MazF